MDDKYDLNVVNEEKKHKFTKKTKTKISIV